MNILNDKSSQAKPTMSTTLTVDVCVDKEPDFNTRERKNHGSRTGLNNRLVEIVGQYITNPTKRSAQYYGKQCHLCKIYTHWRSVCRSKKDVHQVNNTISQMCVQDNSDEDDSWMDSYFIDTVGHTQSSAPNRVFVNLGIGPHFYNIRFKIDTGSSVNTLPKRHLEKLNVKSPLEAPDSNHTSYFGNKICRSRIDTADLCN